MIRKSLLCLCCVALAACARRGDRPDVDRTVLSVGDSTLLGNEAVLSPDGARLAYSMQIEGVAAIYVSGADGSTPVRLTRGIWETTPLWSPDGRWIAYYSDHNADVWVVPSAGGESRQLTSGPARDNPRGWLRDGSGVIVTRTGAGDDQTLVAPFDSGPVRPLFAAPAGNVYAYPSPDGSRVAFILGRGGRRTIWVQDTSGAPARQLTTDGLEDALTQRMWSPDGRFVLFMTRRTGTGDVWSANVETGELHQLTTDIRNDWDPAWSRDGRWVLFNSDRGGQQDLWVVAAEGGPARRVTNDVPFQGNANWTPDGHTIVYSSSMQHTFINAMPADGGSSRALVTLEGYGAWGLALSPDGRTLLFSSNRSADADVWSVPLAGGDMTPFAASPNWDVDADWSPDGRWVSFSSGRGGTGDIWVMPAGGGDARQLTDWPSDEGGARWSPDGKTIAFTSTRDATQPEVWTIPAAGGQATRITRGNVSAQDVRWAPDGRTLFYVGATADGSRQLFRVGRAGGTPRQLTHGTGGAGIFGHAASPDGAQVAYSFNVAGLAYLEVMPAAGGPSRRFHPDTTRAWQSDAAWSPDGSRLAFSNWDYVTNHANLTTVSLAQGEMRKLTTTTDVFEIGTRWTPDGRTLVYVSTRGSTRVVTADVSRLLAASRP